jgi:energy-coupling factor transport system permease protein
MRNAGLLFYRRLASPLHATRAGLGAIWALALTAAALILYNPLPLAALAVAVLGAGVCAGVGRQLTGTLCTAVIVGLPIVAINVLASREGLTVFARLGDLGPFGQGDLTVEAVVYGAVIALKVTLLMLITTLASLAVDPDELLRGFRRLSFRSALTASLATRMIPVLAADAQRLAEAQRTRPEDPARGIRGRVALLSAIVGGSLERSMEVAATLELRGFAVAAEGRPGQRWPRLPGSHARRSRALGSGSRPLGSETSRLGSHAQGSPAPGSGSSRPASSGTRPLGSHARVSQAHVRRPWSRHDLAFLCSAFAVLALALAGRLTGAAAFEAYPLVQMQIDAGTFALSAALLAAILLPFLDRRGIDR